MMPGIPDFVTALIDKNTVEHNGMIREPVSIVLPSLQNITSVSVGMGRTSSTGNRFLPNFEQRPGHESEVWREVNALTLHLCRLV